MSLPESQPSNNPTAEKIPRHHLYFSDRGPDKHLGKKTSRSSTFMVFSQIAQFVLQLGGTMALARLLTPNDFGLVGMVAIITNFIVLFSDFGLTQATVQRDKIQRQQIDTLFWINLGICTLLTIIVAASSPLLSWFYGKPQLISITLALSLGVLLTGLSQQHRALLMRENLFGYVALSQVLGMTSGVVVGVSLAIQGYGYWALVAQVLAMTATRSLLFIVFCGWLPGRPHRNTGVRPFLHFGVNLAGFKFINFFLRSGDNILIGWRLGAAPLGLYTKAYQLMMIANQFNGPLSLVFQSSLSRLQNDPEEYRACYRKTILTISYLSVSSVFFMAASARECVLIALGPAWEASIPLLLALMPVAYVSATNIADGIVYTSLGKTNRLMKWYAGIGMIIILCMIVGLHWGAIGVAIGTSVGYTLVRPFSIRYCFKGTPLRQSDFYLSLLRPTLLAAAAAASLCTLEFFFRHLLPSNTYLLFFLKAAVFAIAFLVVDFLAPGKYRAITCLLSALKAIRNR